MFIELWLCAKKCMITEFKVKNLQVDQTKPGTNFWKRLSDLNTKQGGCYGLPEMDKIKNIS